MHPAIHYYLMQARTADLREQARRDALARAVRQARRARRHQPGQTAATLLAAAARRVLAAAAARTPWPAQ